MSEVRADARAEAQAAAERAAQRERAREQARARAKRSYERRKRADKVAQTQTGTPPPTEEPGLGAVADAASTDQAAASSSSAWAPKNPTELAQFFAAAAAQASAHGGTWPAVQRVVAASGWADAAGQPTPQILLGCQLAWPWLSAQGWGWLDQASPALLAGAGALIVFGPMALAAYQEFAAPARPEPRPAAANVVEINPAAAEGSR